MLEFGGNFNKYITSRGLQKQEGVIFRHLLRLILLVKEFQQFTPPDCPADEWLADLRDIADRLADCCRHVDPQQHRQGAGRSGAGGVLISDCRLQIADCRTLTASTPDL